MQKRLHVAAKGDCPKQMKLYNSKIETSTGLMRQISIHQFYNPHQVPGNNVTQQNQGETKGFSFYQVHDPNPLKFTGSLCIKNNGLWSEVCTIELFLAIEAKVLPATDM